jgi:hypothetical protein
MAKSPVVILYDAAGVAMAVENGVALPANTRGLLVAGKDGANARFFKVAADGSASAVLRDNSGNLLGIFDDAGTKRLMVQSMIPEDQPPIAITIVPPNSTLGLTTGTVTLGGSTAGTLQVIRSTTYNEPVVNGQRSLSSASAADAAAGTGARQVTITYFTQAGVGPVTEVVTLNGTTAVATVATNICFIEKVVVTSVGSGGANAGVITLYVNSSGGGGTIGAIGVGSIITAVGDNKTLWAHHYVAPSYEALFYTVVSSAASGGSGTNATFILRVQNPLVATDPDLLVSDLLLTNGPLVRTLAVPIKVVGFKRVTAYGIPAVNNATLTASFDFSEAPV